MGVNIGSTAIAGMKLGSTAVSKVCLGDTQIWPDSPSPTPAELYGVLYCYEWSSEWEILFEEGCSSTIVDNDKLNAFIASVGRSTLDFEYEDNAWICNGEGEPISTADMPSTTGISVTLNDPDWAMFRVGVTSTIDTTSTPFPIALPDEHGVEKMLGSYYLGIYTEPVPNDAVVSFSFGSTTTETPPDGFLDHCQNLVSISFDNASSLERIGNSFLFSCTSFNTQFTLPNSLTEIGDTFMAGCTMFNQPVDLNNVEKVGKYFMQTNTAFSSSLTVNQLEIIGERFMQTCSSFTGPLVCNGPSSATGLTYSDYTLSASSTSAAMFATGVTLTGPYASVWKDRFYDISNPSRHCYRKLIVSQ